VIVLRECREQNYLLALPVADSWTLQLFCSKHFDFHIFLGFNRKSRRSWSDWKFHDCRVKEQYFWVFGIWGWRDSIWFRWSDSLGRHSLRGRCSYYLSELTYGTCTDLFDHFKKIIVLAMYISDDELWGVYFYDIWFLD
jgi:hypothetical protein